jgi:T4 gene Gp59 loader of gp41 DNA helicase
LTPYKIYCEYLSLKSHFNTIKYNFFKYARTGGVSLAKFEARRDRYFFEKLSRHPDPRNLMIANFVRNPGSWIGDIISEEGHRVYDDWSRRKQSQSYIFKQDLKQLLPAFDENIKVADHEHPPLIKLYMSGKISPESFVIIVELARCYSYWNKTLGNDDVMWREVSLLLLKYRAFIQYDRDKYRGYILNEYKDLRS